MKEIRELVTRISTETSILFLGQEYKKGLFIKALNEVLSNELKDELFEGYVDVQYADLIDIIIDYCEEYPDQEQYIIDELKRAETLIKVEEQILLKDMGWCGVVTTLFNQMPAFTGMRIVLNRADIKNDYFTRINPYLTYLYGKIGSEKANIPTTYEEKMLMQANKNEIWSKIITRIKMSGFLVIDGWNFENDLIKIDDLNSCITLPQKSIYIFSATDGLRNNRNIRRLVSKGIAILFDESLEEALFNAGYEPQDFEYNISEDDGIEITIDSILDKSDISIRHLNYQVINQLDSAINVLDDSILENPNYIDREEYFLRFLSTENNVPIWGGFASGFYFSRDVDKVLLEKVKKQIKNTDPAHNHVIVLEGNNSSGKTLTLGNLAYQLRLERKYPVIYITEKMKEKEQYEDLERLIKNHINERMGARKTVIIWDKNTYGRDEVYENLRRDLEECNVVVVGSRYIVDNKENGIRNIEAVTLEDYLHDETEMISLRNCLQSVSSVYASDFDQIVNAINNVSNDIKMSHGKVINHDFLDKGNWFLLILNRLFEDLHEIQKKSVSCEVGLAQKQFSEFINKYSSEIFNKSIFAKMYEMMGYQRTTLNEYHREDISNIFNMIAVAGKYGLELPAMIIYRAFETYVYEWHSFIHNLGQNSVIVTDLHEDGIMMLRFRRALEAALFLEQQVSDYEELLELEVNSLLEIIRNTNFSDMDGADSEALQVVNLIRKFGPNGPEPNKYRRYFVKIAKILNEINDEVNDEAILVASHLVREALGNNQADEDDTVLFDARLRLRKAISRYGNTSRSQQLVRLKVELSANLLRSISETGDITKEEQELYDELSSYLESAMENELTRFSVGVFLDASLRVYRIERSERKKAKILSRMLQIVDDVNDVNFYFFGENIHSKILEVLSYANKYDEIEEENALLLREGSDVGIYRQAMKCLDSYFPIKVPNKKEKGAIANAITVLEKHFDIVKSRPRSLYLYIRLLWINITGNPIFCEKQFVSLTDEEWKKFEYLCNLYVSNEESQKKPFPYFLLAMNMFRNGNVKGFKEITNITREFKNQFSAYVTYAILCDAQRKPIKEDIRLKKSSNRRTAFSAIFDNSKYEGVEAYFKDSNFKDEVSIYDGKKIESALIGFNLYGVVVYGEMDLYSQIGGKN